MTSNATRSSSWQLYVILDQGALGRRDPAAVAAAAIRGGADVLQWRNKRGGARQSLETGRRILERARAGGVPLIVNDRADLALAIGADGVHVGQDDLPPAEARRLVGPGRLIGVSTHSLEQARAAQAAGADYIGFGPVFATPTKPDYGCIGLDAVAAASGEIRIPVACIGGIDHATLPQALDAGARCVAVVRAVCAADDPEGAARALKQALTQYVRTGRPAGL